MNDLMIFVPTYKRVHSNTIGSLIQESINDLAFDYPVYSVHNHDDETSFMEHPFTRLECETPGIANVRKFCGEFARQEGCKKFLMLDDDLKFFHRLPDDWKLRPAFEFPGGLTEILEWVSTSLDSYAHAAISAREGNNRVKEDCKTVGRPLRALAYQTDAFLSVEHGRVPVMEDFDVTLQLLRKGLPNVITYKYAQDQKGSNDVGGCSEYRTAEVQAEGAYLLKSYHPQFVKTVKKETKGGWFGGERVDVQVQWKKAFEDGELNKALGAF